MSFDDPQTTGMQRATVDLDSASSDSLSLQAIDVYGFAYTDSGISTGGGTSTTTSSSTE